MSANDAVIVAEIGASGQGKSLRMKRWIVEHKPARLLIWDAMDEYRDHAREAKTLAAALAYIGKNPAFALRYIPRGEPEKLAARFDAFCSIAYACGNVALVVEELQQVTKPGYAPAAWSDCTLRGRHRGLSVFGLSQRPASVDKNFFSNATLIRTGRINFAADVKVMADVLSVPGDRISGLQKTESGGVVTLQYCARNMGTGETVFGETVVGGGKKTKK